MTRSRADLLARLDEAVLDCTSLVADILRTCLMLGIRIGATSLRQWATAELEGYRSFEVPEYRKIRAPILQVVADPRGGPSTQLLNVLTRPEPIRKAVSEIVPLKPERRRPRRTCRRARGPAAADPAVAADLRRLRGGMEPADRPALQHRGGIRGVPTVSHPRRARRDPDGADRVRRRSRHRG